MRKNKAILILAVLFTVTFAVPCAASDNITTINDLIENSVALDNKEVTIQGEAIGEALERGEYAWININDTTNAIGVWVKTSDIAQIKYYGDYKNKGDVVKVTGIYHRACSEHGGDIDVHCESIEVVESGYAVQRQLSPHKIIVALTMALLAAVIVLVFIKSRRQAV